MPHSHMIRNAAFFPAIFLVAAATSAAVAPAADRTVYSSDFEEEADDRWSARQISTTPVGKRRFLGNFGAEKVTLSLSDLPEHRLVRVSFDLLLIHTWDGSSQTYGPDVWELSVDRGQRLVYSSFTNCGFFSVNNAQSFPDNYPCKPHPGWTGAAEKQSLGYSCGFPREQIPTDAVYHLDLLFPHGADSLRLNFLSHSKDTKENESWGLDNIKVQTIASVGHLPADEMNDCWQKLSGSDPVAAFESVWKMTATDDQAVTFIRSKLVGPENSEPEIVEALLRDLDDDNYRTRERATKKLIELGAGVVPRLQRALAQTKSAEVKVRVRRVLQRFRTIPEPERLQRERAMRVLEVIGSAKSRKLQGALGAQ